jgi:hypothetical protein
MITKFIIVENPGQGDEFVKNNVNEILNDIPELIRFLMTECPEVIVKINLEIFEDDYDEDRDILSSADALSPILNIVKKIKAIPITEDSEFFVNLRDVLIPFYAEVFTQTIQTMKIVFDNYNRYLILKSRYMEMINIIVN